MSSISLVSSSLFYFIVSKCTGFKHKELRGKLAIGITANFINRNTAAEAHVAEISGVARIYNQKFFQQLLTETGKSPPIVMFGCMNEDTLICSEKAALFQCTV